MRMLRGCAGLVLASLLCGPTLLLAQSDVGHRTGEPRARDIGIPFDGTPGPLNAITDVVGVEVGFKTLISGEGRLVIGKGPVRTGVTAILPRGKSGKEGVFAGFFSGNGNGDIIAAKTMIGPNYWVVPALPHDQLQEILRKHNVLRP
jgi:hypothetical protein